MENNDLKIIRHNFQNCVTSITSMAQAASTFIDKVADKLIQNESITEKQIALFKESMEVIKKEIIKAEELFLKLLQDKE